MVGILGVALLIETAILVMLFNENARIRYVDIPATLTNVSVTIALLQNTPIVTPTTIPTDTPEPSATLTPTVTATELPPTQPPVPTPTDTTIPPTITDTPSITPTLTITPIPPTRTPILPTATPTLTLTPSPPTDLGIITPGGDNTTSSLPVTHIVQPGETLSLIAHLYGVSVDAIIRANKIAQANNIIVGQKLIIPVPGPSVTDRPTITPTATATAVGSAEATNDQPTTTPTVTKTPTITPTPGPPTVLNDLPIESIIIMPDNVRQNIRKIYAMGHALGRSTHAFSKLGDSIDEAPLFLSRFDSGPYKLGPYDYLQPVVDNFYGSFARVSVAVQRGLNTAAVFDPLWVSLPACESGEHMLACEIRLHNPSIMLIQLGSNDVGRPASTDKYFRQIVEYCIANGVIPVLGTKADRHEGPGNINNDIVRQVAADYNVPLWDFDLVAATIPGHGLEQDNVHLTSFYLHDWTLPLAYTRGYGLYNLSALMALDGVWREAVQPEFSKWRANFRFAP